MSNETVLSESALANLSRCLAASALQSINFSADGASVLGAASKLVRRRRLVPRLGAFVSVHAPPRAMHPRSPAESIQAIRALLATPPTANTPEMPPSDSLMGLAGLLRSGISQCPLSDSNRHGPCRPRDFKSTTMSLVPAQPPAKEVLLRYSLSGGRADDVEGKLAQTSEGNRPAEGPKLPKVLIGRAEQAARVIDWVPSTKTGGPRGSEAWLADWQPPGRSDQQEAVARAGSWKSGQSRVY
jgi:hypothetical protein